MERDRQGVGQNGAKPGPQAFAEVGAAVAEFAARPGCLPSCLEGALFFKRAWCCPTHWLHKLFVVGCYEANKAPLVVSTAR